MAKTSDAQKRASCAWEARNPEKAKKDRYHRTARLFIRSHATLEDIQELRGLLDEREKSLQK